MAAPRRTTISRAARADLRAIWTHLATEANPRIADRVLAEIHAALELLSVFPGMGHERRDVRDPRLRFWMVEPYVIAYRFTSRTLQVKRVVHGARDFRREF